MRSITRKIIAVVLLLIFLEKAGLRLFIHDHIHANKTSNFCKANQPTEKVSTLQCDCLDDFFIPLQTTDEATIPNPTFNTISSSVTINDEDMILSSSRSYQQRGPPVI